MANVLNKCKSIESHEVPKDTKGPQNPYLATTPVASHAPDVGNNSSDILIKKSYGNSKSPKNPYFS